MYNGIGLSTVRGSGTNGYVQRNTAHISKGRAEEKFKTEDDIRLLSFFLLNINQLLCVCRRLDAQANREPNLGILEHERKRKLEVKCLELEEVLEEQGLNEEEIEEKVDDNFSQFCSLWNIFLGDSLQEDAHQ